MVYKTSFFYFFKNKCFLCKLLSIAEGIHQYNSNIPRIRYLTMPILIIRWRIGKRHCSGHGYWIKWGAPFNGFEFIYQSFNNDYIANNESIYRTTSIGINIYKLRWYLPLISDQSSIISAYISGAIQRKLFH